MCCRNEPKLAKKLYRRIKKGKVKFYKIYTVYKVYKSFITLSLYSPIMYTHVNINNPGIVKSNSNVKNTTKYRDKYERVERGIHVYENKKIAEQNKYNRNDKVFEVKVKAEDLLAYNYKECHAVFTKIEIPEKEWNRIIDN